MRQADHTKIIAECRGICFSYDHDKVLHDVDLEVHVGDYLGIVGPNGGGKTTLLKIFLGLLKPQCGTVQFFGKDLHAFKDWSKIGYVPQKATSFDQNFPATVTEVVMMGRYGRLGLMQSAGKSDVARVHEALRKVEMAEFAGRLIGDLSSGQQQRVFIARALVSEPEIIFLDEPTTGVDLETQKEFYMLLRKLNRAHDLTLVLVSHDLEIVQHEATEIATVNQTLKYKVNKHYHA